jgi:hypothetical protein
MYYIRSFQRVMPNCNRNFGPSSLSATALGAYWSSRQDTSIRQPKRNLLNEALTQALIRSSEYHHNQQPCHTDLGAILPSTISLIFLGTPHRGSSKATLGKLAAKAGKALGATDKLLEALERGSELLEQQRNLFDSIRRGLHIVCLYEDLPMKVIGMVSFQIV